MTVETTSNKARFTGNGASTTFPYTFLVPDAADLQLWYTDVAGNTSQISPSLFSVTGINNVDGGIVTYPLTGSPIPVGSVLAILRVLPYTQTVDLNNQDGFYPDVVEGGLDSLEMQLQQLIEVQGRNLTVGVTDVAPGQLPSAANRANQLLGFDSAGDAIAAQPSAAAVSSAMQPVVAAATLAAALALLGGSALPAGIEADWPGLIAPTGWYFEYGQAVSRSTNPNLLLALAPTFACTITSGSASITGISSTDGWYTGMPIESSGFAAGTTVTPTSATTATASVTASGNSAALTAFPFGDGDGSTTFNVPDGRGYVYAGKDNMGGAAAGRLTSTYFADAKILGQVGGAQSHTLTTAEMPAHTHTATDSGHTHTVPSGGAVGATYVGGGGGNQAFNGAQVTGSSTASITNTNTGGGTAHGNVPPTSIRNKIIKGG